MCDCASVLVCDVCASVLVYDVCVSVLVYDVCASVLFLLLCIFAILTVKFTTRQDGMIYQKSFFYIYVTSIMFYLTKYE